MMISNRARERGGGREVEQAGTGLEAGFVFLYCTSLKAHFLTVKRDKKKKTTDGMFDPNWQIVRTERDFRDSVKINCAAR